MMTFYLFSHYDLLIVGISNPILYTDDMIMTGLIVCCLVVLSIVMIPKALRHRRQVKQNEKDRAAEEEQEMQMMVVPSDEARLEKSMADYRRRFLVPTNAPSRDGKLVGIRNKYHNRISKIVRNIGDNDVTIFSYIDNVLKHHFETFQDDISGLYKQNCDDDYLIPKK